MKTIYLINHDKKTGIKLQATDRDALMEQGAFLVRHQGYTLVSRGKYQAYMQERRQTEKLLRAERSSDQQTA